MKSRKTLFILLAVILFLLLGSSVYINFIAKTSSGFTYILLGQMFLGIVSCLMTLFIGLNVFLKKKNYELLFISFLEILFVLGLIVLNYVYGYKNVTNMDNYIEYMEYVSMEFNIYIYLIFMCIIGLLTLNLFIKEKLLLINKKEEVKEEEAL